MSGVYRAMVPPQIWVGSVLLSNVLGLRVSFGWDQRVSECMITLPTMPAGIRQWDRVTVVAGPEGSKQYGRFVGYYLQNRRTLAPIGVELQCYGPLIRARIALNRTEGGTDMTRGVDGDGNPLGEVEETMVTAALDAAGLTIAEFTALGAGRYILGTGKTLGTLAYDLDDTTGYPTGPFTCRQGESWLSFIERLEEVTLGYRTFDTPSGFVVRELAKPIPSATAALTFTEGTDIFSAELAEEMLEIKNEFNVTGFDPNDGGGPVFYSISQGSPYLLAPDGTFLYVPEDIQSDMIEKAVAADVGDGIACDEVALWKIAVKNRLARKLRFRTPSAEIIGCPMTIAVNSPTRLGYSEKYVVQRVDLGFSGNEGWSQDLTVIGGVASTAPIARAPRADFTVTLEAEQVVIGGVEDTLYTVHCRSTSFGLDSAISSYAWSATGGRTGTGEIFTTGYTDPAGKSVTLTVTDANGQTASQTYALPAATSAKWLRRALYAAAKTVADCLDGATWRTDAQDAAADVVVVGNGPVWGAAATVMRSADYLVSSAGEATPFDGGATVGALWMETDVSSTWVLAGASDGRVAISKDAGATWSVKTGPSSDPVIRCIINRYNTSQWFVLTATALYDTVDEGATWSTLRTAAAGYTFYDFACSWDRAYLIVGDDGAGNPYAVDSGGTVQTWPVGVSAGCYAVAPRILGGYAVICSDGTTYLTGAADSSFTKMTDLPAGCTPLPRSLWRDGALADIFYIAGGTGGAWKSLDGFATAEGYYQMRSPGVGNCPADADYRQIGADGLLSSVGLSATVVSDSTTKVKSLWSGGTNTTPPTGWKDTGYTEDGTWVASTEQSDSAEIGGGAKDIWAAVISSGTEECLFRRTFTLDPGVPVSCSFQITADDVVVECYINGYYLGSKSTAKGTVLTITITPDLLIPGGSNVLAIWVRNADA